MAALTTPARLGWALWGLGLLLGWGGTASTLLDIGLRHPTGLAAALPLELLVSPAAIAGVTLSMCAGWVMFATGRHRLGVATGWALALLLYSHLELSAYPDHHNDGHGDILPGAALIFWVLWAWGTRGAQAARERAGVQAACGVVAAVYLWAGVSKLRASGPLWALDANLPLLIAERAVIGPAWLRPLREAVAYSPALCTAMATAALLVELSGPLFLWPRFRPWFALAAISMHMGVGLMMGYAYVEWWLTLLGLALLSRPTAARSRG